MTDDTELDDLIERFGKDVVANAIDQGIDAVRYDLKRRTQESSGEVACSEEMAKIALDAALVAAEGAIGAFFSNHELVGGFSIKLVTEDGKEHDLSEAFGAPLAVAISEDGWPVSYSKYITRGWYEDRSSELKDAASSEAPKT